MELRPIGEADQLVLPATLDRNDSLPLDASTRPGRELAALRWMESRDPHQGTSHHVRAETPSGFVDFR